VQDLVETHMSWVVLTEHHAFKRKKPLQLPYVDYRTVERRHESCDKELRLGMRTAASVYESVQQVAGDWVLVMRRLPADLMLPAMLANGRATMSDADAVGDLLADFYATSPHAGWGGGVYVQRVRRLVRADAQEIHERGGPRGAGQHLLAVIEEEAFALAARAKYVVDAHGDLRPEHVCLETPPVIIDPLEIDELRMLDPASELAFFIMECERLGAAWFGERVLSRYSGRSGDMPPPAILELYGAQHALTRALIAQRHLDDALLTERPRLRERVADYLARAS
jgi:aminoglycoside phosphotransferase family enzyme